MGKCEVAVTRVRQGLVKDGVRKAIGALGGISRLMKDHSKVFIKPNAVVPLSQETGVVTNPSVIAELVELVLDAGADVATVGDSPFIPYKSREVLLKTGIEKAARDAGAKIAYLDEEQYVEVKAPAAKLMDSVNLPKSFLDCDFFISVPKMKTHNQTIVSLSIKNQHGLLRPEDKRIMHRDDIHQKIVDITSVAKPNLIIVDGTIALEGQGPTYGSPVQMNLLIAGANAASTDAVSSFVMGFEPESITSLRLAQIQGLGTLDLNKINIKGEDINNVRRQFKRPSTEIIGVFPNVNAIIGGACEAGCCAWARLGLDGMKKHGILERLTENVNIITGVSPPVRDKLPGKTFVIGDCAVKHKDKGIFIPGCPPFDAWKLRTYF